VVTAEPVTSIDVTSADAICDLDDELRAAGVRLCFAEMKDPVKEKLTRFGLMSRFGEAAFFATIEEAVSAFAATSAARGDVAARRQAGESPEASIS
jgi:MFS superfamily sulfate permease-like transporter